jgi:predicted amidohydrolase
MKISVAQIRPASGDMAKNLDAHLRFIQLAASLAVDALFFPELSLTGYEPGLAKELATTPTDPRFNGFQEISNRQNITIGLGVPTINNPGICISMLIFQPNKPRQTYSKQQLHPDEFPFFVPGDQQTFVTVNHTKIAPAICYESLQPNHAATTHKMGAEIYVASVAKSRNGLNKALIHYPAVAKEYGMPVLMANCVGYCDNFVSLGNSSVWTNQGVLVGQLDDTSEGLLIFDTERETITEWVIKQELPLNQRQE